MKDVWMNEWMNKWMSIWINKPQVQMFLFSQPVPESFLKFVLIIGPNCLHLEHGLGNVHTRQPNLRRSHNHGDFAQIQNFLQQCSSLWSFLFGLKSPCGLCSLLYNTGVFMYIFLIAYSWMKLMLYEDVSSTVASRTSGTSLYGLGVCIMSH